MRSKTKYAIIGYLVSKFVVPVAKSQAKKSAKTKAKNAVSNTRSAINHNPIKTSVAVGASLGAIGWLVSRGKVDKNDEDTI